MSNKKDRRRAAAPQAKGYSEAGASLTRRALKGFIPDSGAPNEDINRNNATLRQRARMLYMAAPVATAAINTNRTNSRVNHPIRRCHTSRIGSQVHASRIHTAPRVPHLHGPPTRTRRP